MKAIKEFVVTAPNETDSLRGIVLFGVNVASYKFALARSILEFAEAGQDVIEMSDLAAPFSAHVATHLKSSPKQGTSKSSRFLTSCSRFNSGEIDQSELIEQTVRLGFENVIDAFHVISGEEIDCRFFVDQRKHSAASIRLTENAMKLAVDGTAGLISETEARWSLVETAWAMGMNPSLIEYDNRSKTFGTSARREPVTSARSALNGYQKGKCFYCYRNISIVSGDTSLADVDHLFPWALRNQIPNVNGAWNLVLACIDCNRGACGKFDRLPDKVYVERLSKRNEYLIASHHPLKQTLIQQTGQSTTNRRAFLQAVLDSAHAFRPSKPWSTAQLRDPTF